MKTVAVSLFLLSMLMLFAAAKGVTTSDSWAGCVGAMLPATIVIYMFLRVVRECRDLERANREKPAES